tara:strand:+ start:1807 stop:3102 length:1296 start_codon:yes stop_codon:yes gene_type:complete
MKFLTTNVFQKNNSAYLDDEIRYIVNSGGSRSSKTYSILQLFVILALTQKQIKISCYRNKRVDSIDTMGQDFENILHSTGLFEKFVHRKKEASFTCKKTNSVVYFAGTELVHKSLGQQNDIIFLNEVSEFSEDVFRQLNQRTRHKVFLDFNPSAISFIDKYKNNPSAIFIHSSYKDNPFLTKGIVNTLNGYNPFKEGSVELSKDLVPTYKGLEINDDNVPPPNEINIRNGTADKFMYYVYCLGIGSEKPNRVFKNWTKCTDLYFEQLSYESYFGLDFGVSSPTAMVEVKFDGDRTFYLQERLYKPSSQMGMPIYEWLRTKMSPKISEDSIIVCDSAKLTMVDELQEGGLMAVGALKGSGSKIKMISQLQGFNVVYTQSSVNIDREYYEYSFKVDRYGLVTDEIDDRNNDHILDATKYIVDYLVRFLSIVYG